MNNFFNLFHKKHRFKSDYNVLTTLKKILFFGVTGFIVSLSFSKFIQSGLIYYFSPSQENKLLIKLNPSLERSVYYASMPMIFGIFQRLYAKYRQQQPYLKTNEQQVEGETLHWVFLHDKAYHHKQKKSIKEIPIVIVLAGSEGLDNTIKHLMLASYNLGFRAVAIDPKDLFNKEKIDTIVQHIRTRYPKSQIFGIGVQYGANLLINYAADHPNIFKSMISIGNPFNLSKSEINLQNSWMWRPLYNSIFQGRLKKGLQINKNMKKQLIESLFQVDKYVYQISDEKFLEWKERNSCINNLHKLKDTTLFIQSKEDPFTQQIGLDERFQNQKCLYVTTQRGGHNEWFQNIWMNRWFISPIRFFLKLSNEDKVLDIVNKKNKREKEG